LSRALVPFLVFVNTWPKVAVAPLFLLWLGYGVVPNMLIGALIGFFPVVINTAVGLTPAITTAGAAPASRSSAWCSTRPP
jgi:NitT/TauT family transport system permease protein